MKISLAVRTWWSALVLHMLTGSVGLAQTLLPPPGVSSESESVFAAKPLYFKGERLRVRLPDITSRVAIESDVSSDAFQITPGTYELFSPKAVYEPVSIPDTRRRCRLWPFQRRTPPSASPVQYQRRPEVEFPPVQKTSLDCDLGTFSRAGLYQLHLQAVSGPPPSPWLYLWVYSGWTSPQMSASSNRVVPTRGNDISDDLVWRSNELIEALQDADSDLLNARWRDILNKELIQRRKDKFFPYDSAPSASACYYSRPQSVRTADVALVFAPDATGNPLGILVLDEELACRDQQASVHAELSALLQTVLEPALDLLADTTYSNRLGSDGKTPIKLLDDSGVARAKATLRAWLNPAANRLDQICDPGFIKEELMLDGVNELAIGPCMRMRPVKQYFRQFELLFRLRLKPAP